MISFLFLIGCSGQKAIGPDPTQTYVGGTEGIRAYLIDGMPPPMIHDDGTFPFGVGVTLENVGESDVGPTSENTFMMVRLEGINPIQFGTDDEKINKLMTVPLKGARRNFDGTIFPGEITTVTFEPLNYNPNIHGNNQFTIRADVCYDYETIATTQICIKDDVLENIQDVSICSLSGEKFPQNSGGPLHITSVIENPMAENKIQINFLIEHVGIGEFFGRPLEGEPFDKEKCDFSPRNYNKYNVDVVVEPLIDDGMTISCSRFEGKNNGRIKLYQGAPVTVSCVVERTRPSSGRVYQDLLNIRLKYRYGQFIETPIIIQDVSN